MKISELIKIVNEIPEEFHENEVVLGLPSIRTKAEVFDRVQVHRTTFEQGENLGAFIITPALPYVAGIRKQMKRAQSLDVLKDNTIIALDRLQNGCSQVAKLIEAFEEGG